MEKAQVKKAEEQELSRYVKGNALWIEVLYIV